MFHVLCWADHGTYINILLGRRDRLYDGPCERFVAQSVAHAELLDLVALATSSIAVGVCQVAEQEWVFYIRIERNVFDARLAKPSADAVRAGEFPWECSLFGGVSRYLAQVRAGSVYAFRRASLASATQTVVRLAPGPCVLAENCHALRDWLAAGSPGGHLV